MTPEEAADAARMRGPGGFGFPQGKDRVALNSSLNSLCQALVALHSFQCLRGLANHSIQ